MEDSKGKLSPEAKSPEAGNPPEAKNPSLKTGPTSFTDSWNAQAESITWDARKLASFKRSYARASRGLARPESTFTFQGHEFVLGYAKYLIQYLDSKLGARQ